MEDNASRALLMAAGVLIGMMVVGLGVYLVLRFGGFSRNMNKEMEDQKLAQYNENFYQYTGRIDITAQEVVTMINFAKQQNDTREIAFGDTSAPYYTVVKVVKGNKVESLFLPNTQSGITKESYEDTRAFNRLIMEFINENNANLFSCNAKIKRVKERTTEPGKYDVEIEYKDTGDIKFNSIAKVCTEITFTLTETGKSDLPYNIHTKDNFEIPKED